QRLGPRRHAAAPIRAGRLCPQTEPHHCIGRDIELTAADSRLDEFDQCEAGQLEVVVLGTFAGGLQSAVVACQAVIENRYSQPGQADDAALTIRAGAIGAGVDEWLGNVLVTSPGA